MRTSAQIMVHDDDEEEGKSVWFTHLGANVKTLDEDEYDYEPEMGEAGIKTRKELLEMYRGTQWIIVEE
jgi:hypothetical protein